MADKPKMFVVRKYVLATSAAEALRKEAKIKASDVWVDDEWRNANANEDRKAMGFSKK